MSANSNNPILYRELANGPWNKEKDPSGRSLKEPGTKGKHVSLAVAYTTSHELLRQLQNLARLVQENIAGKVGKVSLTVYTDMGTHSVDMNFVSKMITREETEIQVSWK